MRTLSDREAMFALASPEITHVLHLAAQAGVRFSMVDPYAYVTANVMGQVVMLEFCRRLPEPRAFHLCKFVVGVWAEPRAAV